MKVSRLSRVLQLTTIRTQLAHEPALLSYGKTNMYHLQLTASAWHVLQEQAIPMSRRMRRRPARLQREIEDSCTRVPGESCSLRRLETHIWHAKRMTMCKRLVSRLQRS